jgi:ABC-type uncharacterized transport system involved in gliding motility auxiliary subunit
VNRKTIFILFLLFLFIIFSLLNTKKIIFKEEYSWKSSNLPENIDLSIPFMKKKIYIDLISKNEICQQYIQNNEIFFNILNNNKKISLIEMNSMGYGTLVKLNFDKKKNLSIDCNISVIITDPYGNMDKGLLFIIFPILIIFYFLFKFTWKYISHSCRQS